MLAGFGEVYILHSINTAYTDISHAFMCHQIPKIDSTRYFQTNSWPHHNWIYITFGTRGHDKRCRWRNLLRINPNSLGWFVFMRGMKPRTLVGNKLVGHSDVVGTSPVGAAPTTSHSRLNTWVQWIGQRQQQRQDEQHLFFFIWCGLY